MFTAVSETTARVVGERRLRTLHRLAETTADSQDEQAAAEAALQALGENPIDVPSAALYLVDGEGREAYLAAAYGFDRAVPAPPKAVPLNAGDGSWPLPRLADSGAALPVLSATGGPGPASERAMVLPVEAHGLNHPAGFFVAGLNARRPWDAEYRSYLRLVAGEVGATLTRVRAHVVERRRAAALVELDRAKPTFSANISHEFRTPLTLLLSPWRRRWMPPPIRWRRRSGNGWNWLDATPSGCCGW